MMRFSCYVFFFYHLHPEAIWCVLLLPLGARTIVMAYVEDMHLGTNNKQQKYKYTKFYLVQIKKWAVKQLGWIM